MACSHIDNVSTNLDKANFVEYFSASQVTIYENETLLPQPYQLIGIVEAFDCQTLPHHAPPNPAIARTNARKKAYQLGANAITFSQCSTITHKECHSALLCLGTAYQINEAQK